MEKINFNLDWQFKRAESSEKPQTVNLPHDAMLYEKRDRKAPTAGACGYFPGGAYEYTKSFFIPKEEQERAYILEFEGVYKNAKIYVGDVLAAERPYGYTNFFVSLNEYLQFGSVNEIKVLADNSAVPNSRWYSGSGIYRDVNLYTGDICHIQPDGLAITTAKNEDVTVKATVSGGDQLRIILYDGDSAVTEATGKIINGEAVVHLHISQPRLWDAEHPELYRCSAILLKDGMEVDRAEDWFGFRTLKWNRTGLYVNNKETLLRGACIHHDNGVLGACSFEDAEERRVRLLKEAGFNSIRCAHNPASKALLNACDRLGMYVMDEFCDNWLVHKNPYDYADQEFRQWWEQDLTAMVIKNHNHPSVIMNSIGNEISELAIPEGQEICRKMAVLARTLDPDKAVTLGVNMMLCSMAAKGGGIYGSKKDGKENTNGSQTMDNLPTSAFFNLLMNKMGGIIEKAAAKPAADKATAVAISYLDIGGYNYAASRYGIDGELHPDRVIVGSETLPKNLYNNWQLVLKYPYVIGDFMWTGWDYLGEAGIGTVRYKSFRKAGEDAPIISGGCGVIDICGKLRPETHWNRLIWNLTDTPGIGVEPLTHAGETGSISMWRDTDAVSSWSWKGYENKKTKVIVYAGGAMAELIVNGKSYGKKKTNECKAIYPKVVYTPGTITAISYDSNGREISRTSLTTAEGKTKLLLVPEKQILHPNGQDLCYLNIHLVGENGAVKSTEDVPVTVTVTGAGRLQALGSAKPNMGECFFSDTHTTYYGNALAVIRVGTTSGKIQVKVSAPGLENQFVELDVQP